MSKKFVPHEPEEELLSVEDAFRDAEQSEARWVAFEQEQGLRRVLIEFSAIDLQEPFAWLFGTFATTLIQKRAYRTYTITMSLNTKWRKYWQDQVRIVKGKKDHE